MSLFGGDSTRLSPSPALPSSSPSLASLAPADESAHLQNAQAKPIQPSTTLDTDAENSEYGTDSFDDDDDDGDDGEGQRRPNKFTGSARTWRGYTFVDREIVASLESMEAADLAAHLYNTHHLKYRVRRSAEELEQVEDWQTKDSWPRKGEELIFRNPFGELEMELVPSKLWSAWPLPPEVMRKREGEGVGRADQDGDTWCIGAKAEEDAGETMREEVLALFLRRAKEQWMARESGEEDEDEVAGHKKADLSEEDAEKGKWGGLRSTSASDVEMRDYDDNAAESGLDVGTGRSGMSGGKRGRPRGSQRDIPSMKPVFLADDDDAWQILGPSVDSLLTRLDHLALSIRRTRLNHTGRGADSDISGSEFTSDAESSGAAIRPRSRNRSKKQLMRTAKITPTPRTGSRLESETKPAKYTSQPLDDDESASDYRNDHTEDSGDTSTSSGDSLPRQTKVPLSQSRRNSDASNTPGFSNQTGLMDWSEVLSIASTIGWNPHAVARTAQRCATLFHEKMSFRKLDESLTSKPPPDPVPYTPSTVPDYAALGLEPSSSPKRRPFFNIGTLRCPHRDCWGSEQDFKIPYRTIEHVMRVHGYDPRTNDAENEERMFGGVHVDGFLQPVTAKQGWLGSGRARSKSVDAKKGEHGGGERTRRKKVRVDHSVGPGLE